MSSRLVIALSLALCSSCSARRPADPAAQDQMIVARYGTPDLICENAGEIARGYLPGTFIRDEWLFTEKSYYFFQRRETIVVTPDGAREVRRLTDAEVADVAETVRLLQQARAQRPATSRASPDRWTGIRRRERKTVSGTVSLNSKRCSGLRKTSRSVF